MRVYVYTLCGYHNCVSPDEIHSCQGDSNWFQQDACSLFRGSGAVWLITSEMCKLQGYCINVTTYVFAQGSGAPDSDTTGKWVCACIMLHYQEENQILHSELRKCMQVIVLQQSEQ